MAFAGPLEDRIALHELTASYGDHICRRDVDGLMALWAEDAQWRHPHFEPQMGKDAIRKQLVAAFDALPMIFFSGALNAVSIQGDHARGRCWVTECATPSEGPNNLSFGLYEDDYIRRGGVWRFGRRRYQFLLRAKLEPLAPT